MSQRQPLYWLAHRELLVNTAALVVFLGLLVPVTVPVWVAITLFATVLALLALSAVLALVGIQHAFHKRPCLYCIQDFPLNGGAQISRFRTLCSVVLFHVTILIVALQVLVLVVFGLLFFVGGQRWAFLVMFGSIIASDFLIAYFTHRHRQLEPWCPVCHPPEGWNSGVAEPVPGPQMTKTS